MSHPSFSVPLFTQLVRRLRHANARYDQIAHQCRCMLHPTYHAKRRAYRAGLRIDTSKAREAWLDEWVAATSIEPLSALDRTAGGPTEVATEIEREKKRSESIGDNARMPGVLAGRARALGNSTGVVVRKQPATPCLSPLGLGLSLNFETDDADGCDVPVPGAPRWQSKPLPEDDRSCGMDETFETVLSEVESPMFDFACRGIDYVSDPGSGSTQIEVAYAGHGATLPLRHPKRKLRDVEIDEVASFSRRPWVSFPDDTCFLGPWWSGAQRRPIDI